MYRTHTCGQLRIDQSGEEVTLSGWVHRRRDHGGLIFIDLRDRWGLTQIVFDPDINADAHTLAGELRSEFVIKVTGVVRSRPDGQNNPNMDTGDIEVAINALDILNRANTPIFDINKDTPVDEKLRLQYRYLDLRRERMQANIMLRHEVVRYIRNFLGNENFVEIETPILFKTTPEGARDYLVPSRVHPGKFYALPQSPQQLKQLIMVAGFDRYFQIARCFRDEDQRGDRQPEFTQLDMEMSFVDREDVMGLIEGLMTGIAESLTDKPLMSKPFPRLTYAEAMDRFGRDNPDIRFGMELSDISPIVANTEFKVFKSVVGSGGLVKGLKAPGLGHYSRKQMDDLTDFVKEFGAKGLAWLTVEAGDDGVRQRSGAHRLPNSYLKRRSAAIIAKFEGRAG